MQRPGFYVHMRRYGLEQRAQAIARADFLAAEYGRDFPVVLRDHDGRDSVAHLARARQCDTFDNAPALLRRQAG